VSIKGVLVRDGRVVLLRNARDEWELPGGKLEPGETPEQCLAREIAEELGITVTVGPILDSWVYEITPEVRVLINTFGCIEDTSAPIVLSDEHDEVAWFHPAAIAALPMPYGYKRAIAAWVRARS
jgi:mutator protein MutT